jgi:hypothetical protein
MLYMYIVPKLADMIACLFQCPFLKPFPLVGGWVGRYLACVAAVIIIIIFRSSCDIICSSFFNV